MIYISIGCQGKALSGSDAGKQHWDELLYLACFVLEDFLLLSASTELLLQLFNGNLHQRKGLTLY